MKKRLPIYIIAVILVVAAGVAVMWPESDGPIYTPPPVYDDDDETPVVPTPAPQDQAVESLVKRMVSVYEESVDVLYNLKGDAAVSRLKELESDVEDVEAQASKLTDTERQEMEQHPDLLEAKKKYDTAVEWVITGGNSF